MKYHKIYVHIGGGAIQLHELRIAGHVHSWEGCDQADGSWIGVIYPGSSQARTEMEAIEGFTVLPTHLNDEDPVTMKHCAVLKNLGEHRVEIRPPIGGGRSLAKALHMALRHPALHPDT